ncbi:MULTISPECIES: ABC transporter permease [Roseobacteraceae]|uniref:Dipeptide transport system permease protein DppB n=1 Tax=Pseudosulfitobacter pseudonitzschiae TaxID=1402135 RepID=A0A221K666_9RHOB|nr:MULTISPECIES: ABC transporter permease [Roseobacteraceae]ASM74353.1 dipeptide transport system permease protein DppB [Pseudosulfitobacter pseudonitzschiae]
MLRLIVLRVLAAVPVMLIVAVIVFSLLRLSPGDPAAIIAGDTATPEAIAAIRSEMGLDQPLLVQFASWIGGVVTGDLGQSVLSRLPVTTLIFDRLEATLMLALSAIVLTVIVAVPLGAFAALRHNTLTDRLVMAFSVAGFSMPAFVVGYILMLLFAVQWQLLPVQGYVSVFDDPLTGLRHLVLPSITLALVFMALITRVTRSSLLEVLGQDFVRTARAKGNPAGRILWRHALPNSAVPIITVIGLGIAMLISGVVVTESVFNIPGIGRLTIDAILARDYPVVQGLMLFFAMIYVGINLLIDIAYLLIDPRIRY